MFTVPIFKQFNNNNARDIKSLSSGVNVCQVTNTKTEVNADTKPLALNFLLGDYARSLSIFSLAKQFDFFPASSVTPNHKQHYQPSQQVF